ncbi:cation:proton antiporter [Ectothiorhodospira marina]|uniref:Kef-type K+ transport system, membrane component KefB n=1 Tax=Ectothiorhodospira marina TaxID=1396821 RepID=A0A1H7LVQ6_9GAMM|nr:cation:proton antiporter [Ectothiorhodospira marina]SEL02808.1 Kef-type K+ transport system, membrane component KefB [Ectothiorhodospira marina]
MMMESLPGWLPVEVSRTPLNILLLGVILSFSIFADTVARRVGVPRISILIMVGVGIAFVQQVLMGAQDAELLGGLSEPLIQLALVMVAFLLGSEFKLNQLRDTGSLILIISLFVIVGGGVLVGVGLLALGFPLVVAISLAAISVATDPAAVTESIRESGDTRLRAKVLLGTVAIDDVWGILIFGISMAVLGWALSNDGQLALLHALWELGGAIVLGALIGLPASWLTGRLSPGEPIQVEAIALILLLAGFSDLLGVSALLASMVAGTLVANLAYHHTRSFREIQHIEWPFLVFFFVLSGASIDLYNVGDAIGLTIAYILLRLVGRILGGYLAVILTRSQQQTLPRHIGLALTPQAGIAIGMGLLAAEQFPEFRGTILSVVVASTITFELIGPVLVRRVLRS